ncbi:MAG: AMP-binding protein [Clostridiales Family XIII bacterium]|jgi:long-chain acyl-CoA synthetase|nr:AMP-binding protein [Clostridiales Family XIII bacterium]
MDAGLAARPWLKYYGHVPAHIDYPEKGMYALLSETAREHPKSFALCFEGKRTRFSELDGQVRRCAAAFRRAGVGPGDRVIVCLPNVPQAVVCVYALNLLGAVFCLVHPLSGANEMGHYLTLTKSRTVVTMKGLEGKFLQHGVPPGSVILCDVSHALPPAKRALYTMAQAGKGAGRPRGEARACVPWGAFLKGADPLAAEEIPENDPHALAAILFSAGTTGRMKGIRLSGYSINANAMQTVEMGRCTFPGLKVVAIIPIFHGFGLSVCIHTAMIYGFESVLVPQFSEKGFARVLRSCSPNVIAGVPTLFEKMLRSKAFSRLDLSTLTGVFSGGDVVSPSLKARFDRYLIERGAHVELREGYGTTECVTVNVLNPEGAVRAGTMGVSMPDMMHKIVEPGTERELPYGQEGELCLTGPTVMLGYEGDEEATAEALRVHADGRTWLHTGDICVMDEDGYIAFRQRLKRMIVTSGYNVYPSQVENALDALPWVEKSCVLGVPDPVKGSRVKALVVLRGGLGASQDPASESARNLRKRTLAAIREDIAGYALPQEIEFVESLPETLFGKTDVQKLMEREAAR